MSRESDQNATTLSLDLNRRRVLRGVVGAAGISAIGTATFVQSVAAHDLEVVFKGCAEVWIVVNDPSEFGVLTETIHQLDSSGDRTSDEVELTPDNTEEIPDEFGDLPVFRYEVSEDEAILAVETGDGRVFENPNDCPTEEAPAPEDAFAIEQGGACTSLAPLRFEDQSVEEFYGYDPELSAENPRQSNFPVDLTEPQTSRLFLYRGPEGLSLVIVHGGDGDPGGAASFRISGLANGEWVVRDDSHEGTEDVFDVDDDPAIIHWAWGASGRNDGAVFLGLGDEFEFTIEPAFNDAAEREPVGDGQVEAWLAISGDAEESTVIELAPDEPVTIRSGSC